MRKFILAAVAAGVLVPCLYPDSIEAQTPNAEVRFFLDDGTAQPKGAKLKSIEHYGGFELWHHSSREWSYGKDENGKPLTISDSELGNLSDGNKLADAVGKIEFRVNLGSDVQQLLAEKDRLEIWISANKSVHEELKIENLLVKDTLDARVEGNQLILEFKPRFHFYTKDTFHAASRGHIDFNFPIVDPVYGYNRYSIWTQKGAKLGAARGYFDPDNPTAYPPPEEKGKVSPGMIINNKGHLVDGFEIEITDSDYHTFTRNSGGLSIGYNTINDGGAVAVHFWYPLIFSFYEPPEDISVFFDPHVTSAVEGTQVQIGAVVRSYFDKDLSDVPYSWTITDASGKPINQVNITGHATALSGKINLLKNKEHVQYATFTMPSGPVKVVLEVNPDGNSPKEKDLTNNRQEVVIQNLKYVQGVGQFELDYDILSRDVAFHVSDSPLQARLVLPRGQWNGYATGGVDVENLTKHLLTNHEIRENPPVYAEGTFFERNPLFQARLRRDVLGDDPLGGKWADAPVLSGEGKVSFGGRVTRPYKWTERCPSYHPKVLEAPDEPCYYTEYRNQSADFNSGQKVIQIRAKVYNGMEKLPEIPAHAFRNTIDDNNRSAFKKKLWWESEPYKVNVIRWMYHQNLDGSRTNATMVDGRYKRTFVQQGEGSVGWSIQTSMDQVYGPERAAARNRQYDQTHYSRAVFASDADVKNEDYPIKSGYYFNPAGEYTVVVETVTFKQTPDDTKDHEELVKAVINAFRYESDLIYINQDGEAVNLQNKPLAKSGNRYVREAASLTAKDPTGVNDLVLLEVLDRKADESRYYKHVEELVHTTDPDGFTHPFWKQVLEGYAESGTASSSSKYRYTEYVKPGQEMYKITERTTVTFRINPANRRIYTHAHMSDGTYRIRVWIADVDLSKLSANYKNLGTLRGVETLDEIEITVKGSMYDDIR